MNSEDLFQEGSLLAGRYRIQGRLGSGGMGTVYRAEDQVLGQIVAIKTLARPWCQDSESFDQLVTEVRSARQVTHKNVCRVYDISEIDGIPFISMEYIDGEDLTSLLRRIGHLSGDKATQVAQQFCAGLHATHEKGILHLDLKPANVMLDGDGNVRIADFGISSAIGAKGVDDTIRGTPAYMAPELFVGGKPSVRSDLYSLGLVLYEIYTGKKLFQSESVTELLNQHRKPILPPSALVTDIDSRVEEIILRCLDPIPSERPGSALEVLAALPGGDPLAETLASGRTPSPELIASSGGSGALTPRHLAILLAMLVLGCILVFAIDPKVKLLSRAHLPKSGSSLSFEAGEILAKLGLAQSDTSTAYGFEVNQAYLEEIAGKNLPSAEASRRLESDQPAIIGFWYRQSTGRGSLSAVNIKGRISFDDPPLVAAGMARLRMDPDGRLLRLDAIPDHAGHLRQETSSTAEFDWQLLLEAAGLAQEDLEPAEPGMIPLSYADQRRAWIGLQPLPPHQKIRVEAASYAGKPIFLRVLEQRWSEDAGRPGVQRDQYSPDRVRSTDMALGWSSNWRNPARLLLLFGAICLAWDSARRRRCDRVGAFRLGLAIFAMVVAFTFLKGDNTGGWAGMGNLLFKGMTHGLGVAAETALYYFALEPYARRFWPETMVGWSRLLMSRFKDPLLGRDLLIGLGLGFLMTLLVFLEILIPRVLGEREPSPLYFHISSIEILMGAGFAAGSLIEISVDLARESMKVFMGLVILKVVLRRGWAMVLASTLIWAMIWHRSAAAGAEFPLKLLPWLIAGTIAMITTFMLIRVGLLALITGIITFGILANVPLAWDLQVWYSGGTMMAMLAIFSLMVWASVTSLGRWR